MINIDDSKIKTTNCNGYMITEDIAKEFKIFINNSIIRHAVKRFTKKQKMNLDLIIELNQTKRLQVLIDNIKTKSCIKYAKFLSDFLVIMPEFD